MNYPCLRVLPAEARQAFGRSMTDTQLVIRVKYTSRVIISGLILDYVTLPQTRRWMVAVVYLHEVST
jgi:hypothetical protein